jgi:hypothetical protein
MKRYLCIGLIALSVIAAAQPEQNNVRKQAETFFANLDKAINAKDNAKVFSMFAKDYYNVDLEGKSMDLAQFKGAIAMWLKSSKDMTSKTLIKNVQLQAQEAVVWTQQTISWKEMRNGKWVGLVETTRWAEQLRWTDGGWKFSSSQQLPTNEPWTFKTNGGG